MEQLYEKYENIQLFATSPEYRNYTLIEDKFYDYETFKNKMQIIGYVQHKFKDPKHQRNIDIYLFKKDSKYITSTSDFKKILDKYEKDQTVYIIMITKEELNVYRRKSIKQYAHLNVKNYLHKHFIMEMNKGPLCSKHSILSPEETRKVCYDLRTHAHKLPAIYESDPQNIWIGGEVNDLIKIESNSEITGIRVGYRIVTPASGKVEQSTTATTKIKTIKKDASTNQLKEGDESEVEDHGDDLGEDYNDDYQDEEPEDE